MNVPVSEQIDALRTQIAARQMTVDEAVVIVVNDIGGFTEAGARDVLTDYRSAATRYEGSTR